VLVLVLVLVWRLAFESAREFASESLESETGLASVFVLELAVVASSAAAC
jgi:hypothetical protein